MLKKLGILTCILFIFLMLLAFALENHVILLSRQYFTLPTTVATEDTYDFVLTHAETDQSATPFYLKLDFDPRSCSLSFSLYSYSQLGIEDLYYVYTYDYFNGNLKKSKYIGNPLNLKEWAPHLHLSEDLRFRTNTILLFSEVLSIIKSSTEPSWRFPMVYCDSRLFDSSGLVFSGK